MAPVLGYWNLRGIAEAIRFLLHHVDEDFVDKRYGFTGAPHYDRSEWLKDKYSLELDFPNLPYFIDGDVKITQSLAILRYLARKHGLDGRTPLEKTRLEMVEQQATDLLMGLLRLAYNRSFETLKVNYLKTLPDKLGWMSKYLAGHDWFGGQSLTYVDFLVYEALEQNRLFDKDIFQKYDNLVRFLQRFESLPNISKYITSEQYKEWPIYAPFAQFGGVGDLP